MTTDHQSDLHSWQQHHTSQLHNQLAIAKEIRSELRQLETMIAEQEKIITTYAQRLPMLQTQLVELQSRIFASGTSN